jgi:acyl-CoA dehydrogenase family protein 10
MLKSTIALADDAWAYVTASTNNDPFGVRATLVADAALWGCWPVSDRCKWYYYEVKSFLVKYLFPIEKALIDEATRRTTNRWTVIPQLEELKEKAKSLGLWNLFCTAYVYGKGLTHLEYAFVCELMGMSFFAPEIFNCNAPDTGNM